MPLAGELEQRQQIFDALTAVVAESGVVTREQLSALPITGTTPGYEVRIDAALLDQVDGPMLQYGMQAMHGRRLELPERRRDWPDCGRLEQRWANFEKAS